MVHTIAHFHLRDCIPLRYKIQINSNNNINSNKRIRKKKRSISQEHSTKEDCIGKVSISMNNMSFETTKAFSIDESSNDAESHTNNATTNNNNNTSSNKEWVTDAKNNKSNKLSYSSFHRSRPSNKDNASELDLVLDDIIIVSSESNFDDVEFGKTTTTTIGKDNNDMEDKKIENATNNNNNNNIDDTDNNVHDQLPNIEEYKAGVHHRVDKTRLRFKIYCSICTFCVLLIIIISVSMSSSNNNDKSNVIVPTTPGTSNTENNDNSNTVTILCKRGSNPNACVNGDDIVQRYNMIVAYIEENGWSDMSNEAQRQAVMFLANEDTQYCIDINSLVTVNDDSITIDEDDVKRQILHSALLERYVISVLYYSFQNNGPSLTNTKWNNNMSILDSTKEVCEWNVNVQSSIDPTNFNNKIGILCNSNTSNTIIDSTQVQIDRIYLPSNNMYGTIPSEIRLLTNLIEFNIYNNEIQGTIPIQLNELTKLQSLIVYENEIDDIFPYNSINKLSNLQILNIGKNHIRGTIPNDISITNQQLQVLNCYSCLLNGTINSLQNMKNLQSLHLGNNMLSGTFSEDIVSSWTPNTIIEIDFSNNLLSGTIPKNIFTQSSLIVLDLHSNLMNGPIVNISTTNINEIIVSNKLQVLALHDNDFSGSIDQWIFTLLELQHLDVSFNQLSGSIPSDIKFLVKLKYFFINNNYKLTYQIIPSEIGMLSNLIDVSFQNTNRIGKIPNEIGNLQRLVYFDCIDNRLTGIIPREIGQLSTLRFLLLRNNTLVGEIPDTFGALNNLDTLLIDNNIGIVDGMSYVCTKANVSSLREVTANCPQIECSCCTKCCADPLLIANNTCTSNKTFYSNNFDPISEYFYVRTFYQLHENDIVIETKQLPYNETTTYDIVMEQTNNATSPADMDQQLIGQYTPHLDDTHDGAAWEEYLEDLMHHQQKVPSSTYDTGNSNQIDTAGDDQFIPPNVNTGTDNAIDIVTGPSIDIWQNDEDEDVPDDILP